MEKIVSEEELKQGDGKEGRPAYVAYQGKVYDVSASKMWRNGEHIRRHHAGMDLTADLPAAPHDASVFTRPTVAAVGSLPAAEKPVETAAAPAPAEEKGRPSWFEWFLDRHPHPTSVHFPVAYSAAIAVFLILYVLTNDRNFEAGAYYLLWGAAGMGAVATLLGLVSWWFNYRHKIFWTFLGKIGLAVAFLVLAVVALTLRVGHETLMINREPFWWVYFVDTVVLMVLAVSGLGLIGDIIMWGKK
jgi:predicted heme/steroid binding protein/uncharacterized membrane protein